MGEEFVVESMTWPTSLTNSAIYSKLILTDIEQQVRVMVRQVGILYCRAVGLGSNLDGVAGFYFFHSLLFCYGSDGIYAVDPVT